MNISPHGPETSMMRRTRHRRSSRRERGTPDMSARSLKTGNPHAPGRTPSVGKKIRCEMGGAMHACAPLPEGRHVDLVGRRQRRPRVRATAASEEDCDGNEPMWSRAVCRSEACRGIVHRCHAMESRSTRRPSVGRGCTRASLRPPCTQFFPIRACSSYVLP